MKKIMAATLSLLACAVLLAGCNISSENNEEQSLKVYSFSGENEYISVSNRSHPKQEKAHCWLSQQAF